ILLNQVSTHISITVLGNTVRSTSPFTIPPPEILTLVPSEVFINASIGITGKHFNKDYTKLFLDTSATAPSPNAMSIPLTTITTSSLSFILREQNYAKLYLYVSVLDQIVRANTPIIYKSLILNDYYPDKATFGDTLTLTGTNFDIGAIDVTFGGYFGNVKQMPLSVTKDTIKVSVPGGLLKDWNYISVLQNGTNYIYPKIFRITPPEIQNVVNPNFTWGDTVTIQGKGFNGVMKEKNVVYLGNISISPVDATNNMLKFIVPDNHLVTSSSVYMNVVGLNSNVFSPVNLLPVEITSLSVSSVGFGEQMIIMGKNFHPNTAYNKVTFASQAPFTVISGNTNSLTVALENCVAGMPGIGTVTVKISGQTSTSTSPITIAASQINDVAPLKVKPGDTITITGSNLEGSNICSEITMGGVPLTYLSGDNTTLTAIVPRIPEGFYPVNVNVLGQTASSVQNVEVFHIWAEQTQLGTITGYQGYFSHLDKGYIMQRISTNTSTLIQFDPVAGSWSNFMEINTPSGYSSGTFVSLGSFGWMLSADTLHRFDPAAKEWLMWDIFPGQNEDLIVGFGIGDKLYFTGGRHYNNGFIYDSAMWIFNTVDNTWSETAGIKCYLSTGFSTGGKGYVAWGDLNTIWEYDPVANNWISLPYTYPPADNKRSWPATAEVSGKVYIGGGNRVIHIGDNT
ncbi:MAG: IPT/TIG domain-containing protein, partial [Cyclobacteriaceae bacterium]|nr:IPT/TIG domain-containing protein [Cyclobacteriaceae bacterium]